MVAREVFTITLKVGTMSAASIAARLNPARCLGMTAGGFVAALVLLLSWTLTPTVSHAVVTEDGAADTRDRSFSPIPGMVRAPILPRSVHGSAGEARASLASVDFTAGRVGVRRATAYETLTGGNVWVSVSERYSQDSRADRGLVDFLESLLHGDEIGGLRLMVLRGDEIGRKCGAGAAACYFPGTDTIVVVGEDRYGGLPTDYVLAHEYGHRIAQFSSNPPFRGGAFWHGPKRWASRVGVCEKLKRGVLSTAPAAYWNFPGENFAEAYARLHIRGQVRWQYSSALRPGSDAFKAIRQDVKSPWRRSRVRDIRATLPPHGTATYPVSTPLDGRFTADLYARGGARFGFELKINGTVIRAPRATRDFRLSRLLCGDRELSITVRAGARGGGYRLVIDRP